jgi:hypothetical protein
MEFKEIAHHYIGIKIMTNEGNIVTLIGDTLEPAKKYDWLPYLYPLSAMTEEQAVKLFNLIWSERFANDESIFIKITKYVEDENSVGFKGFDLLDNGDIGLTVEKSRGIELSFSSKKMMVNQFVSINYLLANHFDLWDLIENGQAIDATTLATNPYQ